MQQRTYIAIDLKSFYASVECVRRGLDPLNTNLVVADLSRTEKTICLAVSPSLKSYGISGRARLFEVVQRVKEVNAERAMKVKGHRLTGSSHFDNFLRENPDMAVDYIVASPRMSLYMQTSAEVYAIYLRYIAPEDIHVYSVDEVFIDATNYLRTYNTTAEGLARRMISDILAEVGITATAGIGTNMYLCKVAMDIVAKHIVADKDGVRIASLDEPSYRRLLWDHRPITDFWRVGRGYAEKLRRNGMFTMGDVARCSVYHEDLLYALFGVNAELLIDHAWGWEPCTIADVRAYRPASTSLSVGQVLSSPYSFDKARLVVQEMTDGLVLDLVEKGYATDQMVLTVGYDIANISSGRYTGEVTTDPYGRQIPKHAHGTENIGRYTSSTRIISDAVMRLFDRIVDRGLLVRRMYVVAARLVDESTVAAYPEQLDLFHDYHEIIRQREEEQRALAREKSLQKTMISLKHRFGKNAVLKGMNLKEGATAIERNRQIGGHKA